MHSSQFDGAAAFSGGGFMPSQATQGPESSFSYSKNRDAQSLLPLTVKQINDAFLLSDDMSNMLMDGMDVNNVTLVGRVCNKAGRITDVAFVLDDGTGRIECSKWHQEDVDTNEAEGIRAAMSCSENEREYRPSSSHSTAKSLWNGIVPQGWFTEPPLSLIGLNVS